MAGEYKQLFDDAKVPAEKRVALEAALAEIDGFTTVLDQGVLRQQDYSRKQDELAARRKELETNWDKANTEYQQMVAELAAVRADVDATKTEKDEAARKLKEAQDKLAAAPQFDPVAYKKEVLEETQKLTVGSQAYGLDALEVCAEHQTLFGTRLSPKQLIQEAMAANELPADYWSKKYNVPAKRTEIDTAAKAAHDAEVEKRGYEKRLAEEANPATRTLKPSQNPFFVPEQKDETKWPEMATETDAERKFREELQQARA